MTIRPRLSSHSLLRGHSFLDTNLAPGAVVVDGGAHKCEFANAIASAYKVTVVALEPNAALEPLPPEEGVTLHRLALAGEDGTATFHIDTCAESSSLINTLSDPDARVATVQVMTNSLQTLMAEQQFSKIALLKLDIEGAEYGVIKSIDSQLAKIIEQITIEFHPMTPEGADLEKLYNIFDYLDGLGFERVKASQSSFGDVIFLNRTCFSSPGPLFRSAIRFLRKFKEIRGRP